VKRRTRAPCVVHKQAAMSRSRIGPTYPLPPSDWTLWMVRTVLTGQSEVAMRMAAEALA
jgi:hypothetical protein